MEILPGIHQIPGLRWSNVYLLVEEGQLTLVDAGFPGCSGKIYSYIKSLGRDPLELRQVILTHGHPDHTGPLAELSKRTGASISVHRDDTRQKKAGGDRWLHYPAKPPTLPGRLPFFHHIPAHRLLEDGETLPVMGGLEILHTPGHTPGSLCFYLPQQSVLFTGDTLIADGLRFKRPLPSPGTHLRECRESVNRLAGITFDIACVGHGSPLMEKGSARLADMLENYSWMAPRWQRAKEHFRGLTGR